MFGGQKNNSRMTDIQSKRELLGNSENHFIPQMVSLVKGLSIHALDRTQDPTRQVTLEGLLDALQKPLNSDTIKVRYNEKGQPSQRFIGQHATVNVNPENGCVTTVWKTGHDVIRKYTKR